jgi:hypothetical protein
MVGMVAISRRLALLRERWITILGAGFFLGIRSSLFGGTHDVHLCPCRVNHSAFWLLQDQKVAAGSIYTPSKRSERRPKFAIGDERPLYRISAKSRLSPSRPL